MPKMDGPFGSFENFKTQTAAQPMDVLERVGGQLAQALMMGAMMKAKARKMGKPFDKEQNASLLQLADMLHVVSENMLVKKHEAGLLTDSEYAHLKAELDKAIALRPKDDEEAA